MVGVEVQAAGLKLLVSDTVTRELKITDLVTYLSLNQSAEEWANEINNLKNYYPRNSMMSYLTSAGYNIVCESNKLEEKYRELYFRS